MRLIGIAAAAFAVIIGGTLSPLSCSPSFATTEDGDGLGPKPPKRAPAPAPRPSPQPSSPRVNPPAPASTAQREFRDCAQCPEMVVVPAGQFWMGSDSDDADERPRHQVTIGRAFAVGKFEVTFREWDACVADNGCSNNPSDSGWGRGTQPVIRVSWVDAKKYIEWLSRKSGRSYRLLTEAEWEYIASTNADVTVPGGPNANCNGCGSQWDNRRAAPVGSFRPNRFGVFDMLGNVAEWVEDCWSDSYIGSANDGRARTSPDCTRRIVRGGAWRLAPRAARPSYRNQMPSEMRNEFTGFRVARSL